MPSRIMKTDCCRVPTAVRNLKEFKQKAKSCYLALLYLEIEHFSEALLSLGPWELHTYHGVPD